jgi:hypothetical protein
MRRHLWLISLASAALFGGCARESGPAPDWARFDGQGVALWLPHSIGYTGSTEALDRLLAEAEQSVCTFCVTS